MRSKICPLTFVAILTILEDVSVIEESDQNPIICFCHRVRLQEIVAAIQRGDTTLEKIQAETGASTGCGGCEYDVLEILEKELAKTPGSPKSEVG